MIKKMSATVRKKLELYLSNNKLKQTPPIEYKKDSVGAGGRTRQQRAGGEKRFLHYVPKNKGGEFTSGKDGTTHAVFTLPGEAPPNLKSREKIKIGGKDVYLDKRNYLGQNPKTFERMPVERRKRTGTRADRRE